MPIKGLGWRRFGPASMGDLGGTESFPEFDLKTQNFIRDLLKQNTKDPNVKIGKDALSAYCAYLGLFLTEAIARAELAAKSECTFQAVGTSLVEYEHLEKIFLQLLLDFQ